MTQTNLLSREEKTSLWRSFITFSNQGKCIDCKKRRKVKFLSWYHKYLIDEEETPIVYCYSCFMDYEWEEV